MSTESRRSGRLQAAAGFRNVRLGEILVRKNLISEEQLTNLLEEQKNSGKMLGRILVDNNILGEAELLDCLAESMGVSKIDLSDEDAIDYDAVSIIPERMARRFNVICVGKENNTLIVATSNPSDVVAIDNIKIATGYDVRPVLTLKEQITETLGNAYSKFFDLEQMASDLHAGEEVETIREDDSLGVDNDGIDEAGEAPVVRYVNSILLEAIRSRASDIHIEPYEKEVRVRFRIDGSLREITPPPKRLFSAVSSRIKIISNLDIAERRLPQDGRCKLRVSGRDIDIRVSTLPCVHGEKVVMRILDKSATSMELENLGMDPVTLKEMKRILGMPHGIILLCGPTGSGKTTTLYSFLKHVYKPSVNIVTIEDPVEYQLHGVNQVQVRSGIGMTFASGLRSILRQDPDVVMVGEMRDSETLEVAVRAALTGHLVFSTIHTNNSVSTITRMIDMGLEPYLVTSALICAVSQRLIRVVCQHCKEEYEPHASLKQDLSKKFGVNFDFPLYRAKGCRHCNGTGYKGRRAIHEYMTMDETLRQMVITRAPEQEMAEYCKRKSMRNLRQSAFMRLYDGVTTIEEVMTLFYED